MDKNTLLAFILIGLIFILLPFYNSLINPPPPESPESTSADSTWISPGTPAAAWEKPVISPIPGKQEFQDSLLIKESEEQLAKYITVRTDLYDAVFSTKGGALVSFVLKKYYKANGDIIDLAQIGDAGALKIKNEAGYLLSEKLYYATDAYSLELSVADRKGEIVFRWKGPSGQSIEKVYHFDNSKYSIGLDLNIDGAISLGCARGYYLCWDSPMPVTEVSAKQDIDYMGGYVMFGDEMLDFKDVDSKDGLSEEKEGITSWVASITKYFTATMIPKSRQGSGFYVHGIAQNTIINSENTELKLITTGLKMASTGSDNIADNFLIYIGPIDYYILKDYEVRLEDLVSMGWKIIQPFSIAVLWLFTQIHKFIPNYGFVIIVFSILIKIVLFPLSRKSSASMAKMADLQPKLKALQEKHKKDRNKQQAEMMKLYKEHGVNPFGGCLPLILQMPLFYALFTVFRSTIELRGAHFIFWIKDLSLMDPYYVLPIIMGLTMFIQQKMTMKDPKQKMMVYMMPVLFTFIFYNMPAGLVLYWTMYNILSFAEQLYVRRKLSPLPTTT